MKVVVPTFLLKILKDHILQRRLTVMEKHIIKYKALAYANA